MEVGLQRKIFSTNYTIGRWSINDIDFGCDSLEDAVRDTKIYGRTAIPEGRYRVIMNRSPRFGYDMPLLLDVPDYEGVRIHSLNSSEDTDGCLGAGRHNPDYNGGDWIGNSKYWTGLLVDRIKEAVANKEEVWITIKN